MGAWDHLIDFGTALGKGVVSVGEDLVGGVERTAQGLGTSGTARMSEIGTENAYLVDILIALVKSAPDAPENPLFKIITRILEAYYEKFPEDALQKIYKTAAIGAGYMAGRMIIGKKLAEAIAKRLIARIAASTAFKQLATKLGVSAAAGSTGVGIVITLVMVQGVGQRASKASKRLKARNRKLWDALRTEKGLDMLYFLVEEPMSKYMDAIDMATNHATLFEQELKDVYGKAHGN
ncbi:hypothetical protein F183_A41900 [Bryobacterales bacterium F-183]|nr:hypothetical protein F183_A41900 [Bryobacterales bacterium F-183]